MATTPLYDEHGTTERFETIVIGGGQAGLSVGYHLRQLGRPFVILDANQRVGDSWRHRWDTLRLFTPARYDGLDGMPFPAAADHFPTKDEMADYLEAYARRFQLPIRHGVRVERLSRAGDRFVVEAGPRRFEADNVVVAMANYQRPKVPAFGAELDPRIVQLHSSEYRRPAQLQRGDVLLVGAGNSAAEIAMDLHRQAASAHDRIVVAGRDTGRIPFRIGGWGGRHIGVRVVLGLLFKRVLTVDTPMGRRVRPKVLAHGGPLIRVRSSDLVAVGVERAPRVAGVRDGLPVLDDGRVLDVANVIWCTGYEPGFSWIELPIHGDHEPRHESGIVSEQPGLYFVGLEFLHALSSIMIHGVGRDAARIARHVASRSEIPASTTSAAGSSAAGSRVERRPAVRG